MQQRMGLDVVAVDCPWGEGVHEDKLEQILKQDSGKKIKAVRASTMLSGWRCRHANLVCSLPRAEHEWLLLHSDLLQNLLCI